MFVLNQKRCTFVRTNEQTYKYITIFMQSDMKREEINVRGTIASLKVGEVVCFPSVVKWSYIRNVCSALKVDENIVCSVNRNGDHFKVTRLE